MVEQPSSDNAGVRVFPPAVFIGGLVIGNGVFVSAHLLLGYLVVALLFPERF